MQMTRRTFKNFFSSAISQPNKLQKAESERSLMHEWFIKDDSCRNKSEIRSAKKDKGGERGGIATQRHNKELSAIRC